MSERGIKLMAEVFAMLQNSRHQLLEMASATHPVDKQDALLAQLCENAKDAIEMPFLAAMETRKPEESTI